MINNRQNGRRRGRGGGQRSPNNVPSPGNRQDNRQRGNAAQLLEKFKSMARDAQLAGDRVQTEYYLQFADHYYRVLNENRARFEEQRRQRDDYGDDEEGDDEGVVAEFEPREERAGREDRGSREDRGAERMREDRGSREERNGQERFREERNGQERYTQDREDGEGRRNGSGRRPRIREAAPEAAAEDEGQPERIALESLPPAIAAADAGEERPRRRLRRPRPEGDTEIAPAA